ncbi:MAG: IS1595 family transposase [Chloroflexi bacterium]|nr:IS1595 family transposase [Chloroflexota bacterium]
MTAKYTIKDFNNQFPDEAACLDYLRDERWPNGIHCESCDRITKHHKVVSRKSYSCDNCGHHVHPTARTIFHKSRTPLTSWFYAMFLMASTHCGISAKQLERELGVTYKTAWRMFKQIRTLMHEDLDPFTGQVEVDETYIGGKRKGTRGRCAKGKTIVAGAVERQGSVVAEIVPDVKAKTLVPIVQAQVKPSVATVHTDELHSCDRLSELGYTHDRVKHSSNVYVIGTSHTNTIEGFWSLVKRGIDGVYHSVSRKYMQSYLDEYSFRYNHRADEQAMFVSVMSQIPLKGSGSAQV